MKTTRRSYLPSGTRYFATYQIQMGSTAAERSALSVENERAMAMPLDHIREVCRTNDTNAEIMGIDDSKGVVHNDGGYVLS